jgi:hypothetical protein
MRPALDPAGHRVPRTKPTCLLHTWRPHRRRPFALVLHLHLHQSSRNLHLQYLAKNQSTQRCQSLITQGSDHPPVLEPQMVLRNTENTVRLYWFGPPESKTLCPVLRLVLLEDCGLIGHTQGIATSALYWPADEVSSQTPGRLRPKDLSLRYTSCRIPLIYFGRNPLKSCLVHQVMRSCRTRSSGESSERSSGGQVGRQLGRLGPLTGWRVF